MCTYIYIYTSIYICTMYVCTRKRSGIPTTGGFIIRGPTDHIKVKTSDSGSKAQEEGVPEIMPCRILLFLWSLGGLHN